MTKLTGAAFDRAVAHAMGVKSVHDCEKWVGLTNNELQPIADEYRILFGSWVEDFARAIEAKLRDKNT